MIRRSLVVNGVADFVGSNSSACIRLSNDNAVFLKVCLTRKQRDLAPGVSDFSDRLALLRDNLSRVNVEEGDDSPPFAGIQSV